MTSNESSFIRSFEIKRITNSGSERTIDTVASEEPLDIRLSYWFKDSQRVQSLALTMRTPGSDRELTAGYLLAEGIITSAKDLLDLRPLGAEPHNEILAELAPHVDVEAWRLSRNAIVNSSCGVCGKQSRDAIATPPYQPASHAVSISRDLLHSLPSLLEAHQKGFNKTGGLHAAALVTPSGEIEIAYEDIGRHNALDKLTGNCLLYDRLPLSRSIIFLSSRSSFELVQKTIMAGGQILATVGSPSSLAIETARAYGLTLVGFLRQGRFNIYSGDWRID